MFFFEDCDYILNLYIILKLMLFQNVLTAFFTTSFEEHNYPARLAYDFNLATYFCCKKTFSQRSI